ncbi:MAG: hypothetical protein K0Q95_84 [Bacteroidota bacterium]|jgi:hypothetical protein|nr:hypothetical protein [Bacteroidota bacterium]
MKINIFVVAVFLTPSLYSQPKQLGKPGDWSNTIKAVESNGKIYAVENSGTLTVTDLSSGVIKPLGHPDYQSTNLIFANNNQLYTIDTGGTLYSVSTVDGSWKRVVEEANWPNTVTAAVLGNKLYTVNKKGVLTATDLSNGAQVQVGNVDFLEIIRLWSANGKLYSHDKSGTLYEVNIMDGSSKQIGATEGWADTKTGVVINNMLYTVESSGTLYETDLTTGKWKQIGNSEFQNTLLMTGAGSRIHTIDSFGSLNEIAIQ